MAKRKMIDLYDTFPVSFKVNKDNREIIMSDSKEEVRGGYSLICEVNATHSGTLINHRIYPPEHMKRGITSWTSPYKKPVLVNHDDTKDPIGRVISAKYLKTDKGMTDDYKPILHESQGYGYQRLTVKITEPEAIKKILDGRYETVSVRMSTDHCFCSVCGEDWSETGTPCDHKPGMKYDGELMYMTTGTLSYREMSFVNIPADEYAGVKEAIISDQKSNSEVSLYANNDSDKVLSDMGSGTNLYSLLDAEAEASDDIVAYLLDKSSKENKEDDVKLTDLTKDQLKDLGPVKELLSEALDKAKKDCEMMVKDCEAKISKMKEESDKKEADSLEDKKKKVNEKEEKEVKEEDAGKKKEGEEEKVENKEVEGEGEDAKKKKAGEKEKEEKEEGGSKEDPEPEDKKCNCGAKGGETHKSSCPMSGGKNIDPEAEDDSEDGKKKKAKKGSPVPDELPENKGKGKSGGVKHGEGNLSPIQEEPTHHGDAKEDANRVAELEDSGSKMLDENVKINAELHKMVSERLFDLKKALRKPDVVSISTQEGRDKKVAEFAQRSIDSLKDQIQDLLVEQETFLATGLEGDAVGNPAISQPDMTDEIMEGKKKVREGKHETLTRLFPKSK